MAEPGPQPVLTCKPASAGRAGLGLSALKWSPVSMAHTTLPCEGQGSAAGRRIPECLGSGLAGRARGPAHPQSWASDSGLRVPSRAPLRLVQ